MESNDIMNYRAKLPKIEGSTTINHNLRVRMGLGCVEFVLMDYYYQCFQKSESVTSYTIWKRTGLGEEAVKLAENLLTKKGFIHPKSSNNTLKLTEKWKSFFRDYEAEFEEFWLVKGDDGKIRTAWPGSKKQAYKLYVGLRKNYSAEYLLHQRNAYFKYLQMVLKYEKFNRAIMMATVFLGKSERFAEDWSGYITAILEKVQQNKNEQVVGSVKTMEDRLKEYED